MALLVQVLCLFIKIRALTRKDELRWRSNDKVRIQNVAEVQIPFNFQNKMQYVVSVNLTVSLDFHYGVNNIIIQLTYVTLFSSTMLDKKTMFH